MTDELLDILRNQLKVDEKKIKRIQELKEQGNGSFIERIRSEKIIEEDLILHAYSLLLGMEVLSDIGPSMIDSELTSPFTVSYLRQKRAIPIRDEKGGILIAVSDPFDYETIDNIVSRLELEYADTVLCPEKEIIRAINKAFEEGPHTAEQVLKDIDEEDSERIFEEIEKTADLLEDTSEAPVIKFVNMMFSSSVKNRASDIHIEPYQDELKIRFRIDGLLHEMYSPPKRLHPSIVSRIKVMAGLNIAEKRIPQDGRIEIKVGDKSIDIRVSTLPTIYGERVVLRLLDKTAKMFQLHELGIPDEWLPEIKRIISMSHGIVLVTGPTGSGKTTTLYAALSEINTPEKNIITIEDPVEYQIPGIGQVNVDRKKGLTFANGLRTIVRQDPDVILVGEIRDLETAEIAIQSALTGHLVFSTLHTNDAASAVTRLIDMGIEPYLITSSVIAIIAQRLVRTVCPYCKKPQEVSGKMLKDLFPERKRTKKFRIFKGTGCDKCLNTGYYGRTGIYEIIKITEKLKNTILSTSDSNIIKKVAMEEGMTPLRQDGLNKIKKGISTPEEILRVTQV